MSLAERSSLSVALSSSFMLTGQVRRFLRIEMGEAFHGEMPGGATSMADLAHAAVEQACREGRLSELVRALMAWRPHRQDLARVATALHVDTTLPKDERHRPQAERSPLWRVLAMSASGATILVLWSILDLPAATLFVGFVPLVASAGFALGHAVVRGWLPIPPRHWILATSATSGLIFASLAALFSHEIFGPGLECAYEPCVCRDNWCARHEVLRADRETEVSISRGDRLLVPTGWQVKLCPSERGGPNERRREDHRSADSECLYADPGVTLLDRKGDLSLSRALAQRVGSRGLAMNSAGDYIVRVGAKHILESNLLCVMIADAITEVEGFEGECVYDNGPGMGAFYALVNDTIHLYVDYTGTVYSEYIRSRPEVPRRLQCPDGNITGDFRCTEPLRDDLRTFDQELRKHLLPRTAHSGDRLAALRMWSVVNNWALLVSKPFAEEHGLVESGASQLPLSLLLAKRDVWAQLKVCGYEEFMYRRDALAGLEQRAGAVVADVDISRPNKRYCRLRRANVTQADGGCTLIDGYQTDPQVTLLVESGDAVEVVDDIQYWPRYTLVALSQQWFADEHLGRLRAALESVHMSQASMLQALNRLTYGTAQPEIDDFEQRCKDGQYGIELSRIRQDPSMRERLAQEAQRLPYVDALTVSP